MSVALHRSPSPRLPTGPPHARPVPVQPEGSRGEGWGEGQKIAPLGCTWLPLTLALSPCLKRHGERGYPYRQRLVRFQRFLPRTAVSFTPR